MTLVIRTATPCSYIMCEYVMWMWCGEGGCVYGIRCLGTCGGKWAGAGDQIDWIDVMHILNRICLVRLTSGWMRRFIIESPDHQNRDWYVRRYGMRGSARWRMVCGRNEWWTIVKVCWSHWKRPANDQIIGCNFTNKQVQLIRGRGGNIEILGYNECVSYRIDL